MTCFLILFCYVSYYNSQHESKEQTVVDVIEQLGNCRLDNQEKATACELPLQNVNTQIS